MTVRQIFKEYPMDKGVKTTQWKYCPQCGQILTVKKEGGLERPACSKCGFIYYKNPAPAVSILIAEQEKVLLGKRAPGSFAEGKWCLPGGFIEFNEGFLAAAIREVQEETGLRVDIKGILSVVSNFLMPELHSLVIVLLAKPVGGELRAGDDITEVGWVPLSGPLPALAFAADRHIIEYYCQERLSGLPVQM